MLRRTYLDKILTAGMFLFYWLLVIQLPAEVPTPQLDPSWSSLTSKVRRSEFRKINKLVLQVATTFSPQRVGVAAVGV